jgi:hypothetical protein
MDFRIVSSTPLPEAARIDAVHFDSELTNCQSSDAAPGGYGGLNLGYGLFLQGQVTGRLANPIDFVDLGHVQLYAGDEKGLLIFEGRVQDIDSPTGLQATAVTATGYGVGTMAATTDMWYAQDAFAGEPSIGGGQLLREVLKAASPLLRVGDKDYFYEPGGAYLRSGESGRYPNQTVDEVVKAGDVNNLQILFAVYEDRVVQMLPRVPPVDAITGEIIADYYVPFDRNHVTLRRSGSLMVGVVAVQFTDPSNGNADHTEISSAQEQQLFRDAHGGLLRGFLVPSSSWTQAQAEFYRDTYLQRYKNAVITCTVNTNETWPVYDRMGGSIPYYAVRSGGWLKVGDQDPIMITSTTKDLKKKTCGIVASSV